jgi:hypothetical protein
MPWHSTGTVNPREAPDKSHANKDTSRSPETCIRASNMWRCRPVYGGRGLGYGFGSVSIDRCKMALGWRPKYALWVAPEICASTHKLRTRLHTQTAHGGWRRPKYALQHTNYVRAFARKLRTGVGDGRNTRFKTNCARAFTQTAHGGWRRPKHALQHTNCARASTHTNCVWGRCANCARASTHKLRTRFNTQTVYGGDVQSAHAPGPAGPPLYKPMVTRPRSEANRGPSPDVW